MVEVFQKTPVVKDYRSFSPAQSPAFVAPSAAHPAQPPSAAAHKPTNETVTFRSFKKSALASPLVTSTASKTPAAVRDAVAGKVNIEIWVPGETMLSQDHLVFRTGDPESQDSVVRDAYQSARTVLEYAKRDFGRNSFDNRGTTLKLRVHSTDPVTGSTQSNNAYWFDDEKRIWIGDGDGKTFDPLGGAPDIVAHEFFHAVIDSEIKLNYTGQQGAIHESFSDVLATGVDGNWQIGEKVFTPDIEGDAIRDLSNLNYKHLNDLPKYEDEVHALSEVPSHAAYLVGKTLGAKQMRNIWYTALTKHMKDQSGFAGAYDATVAAARTMFGVDSREHQVVNDAWIAVGINSSTPKK